MPSQHKFLSLFLLSCLFILQGCASLQNPADSRGKHPIETGTCKDTVPSLFVSSNPDAHASNDASWTCLCNGAELEYYIRRGIHDANVPKVRKQSPGSVDPNTPSAFQDPSTDLSGFQVYQKDPIGRLDESLAPALVDLDAGNATDYYSWTAQSIMSMQPAHHAKYSQYTYTFSFSPHQGVMIAEKSICPSPNAVYPPKTKHWSDVAFLGWSSLCAQQSPPLKPGSLRSIILKAISNPITTGVIDLYAPNVGPWPGLIFDIKERGGQALLGTPSGKDVGFLILQHQKTFGDKKVQEIRAWSSAEGKILQFMFGEEKGIGEPEIKDWSPVPGHVVDDEEAEGDEVGEWSVEDEQEQAFFDRVSGEVNCNAPDAGRTMLDPRSEDWYAAGLLVGRQHPNETTTHMSSLEEL